MKEEIFKILCGKDTVEVYREYQKLESDIQDSDFLYQYFDDIKNMLSSDINHIRVRGFRIICLLSKYDDHKINDNIDILLNILDEAKSTSVRRCLESLNTLLLYKPELSDKIENKLRSIDCSKYKDSMSPLIQKDIDYILNHM